MKDAIVNKSTVNDKLAIIIVGNESSGTKALTRIFVLAGCYGDHTHTQRLDKSVPADEKLVVLRRSYPHGGDLPDLASESARFVRLGYTVKVIVIVRSMQWVLMSRGNKSDQSNLRRGYSAIGRQLWESNINFIWITYESLVQHKLRAIGWLFDWCGIKIDVPQINFEINDGNEKYVQE